MTLSAGYFDDEDTSISSSSTVADEEPPEGIERVSEDKRGSVANVSSVLETEWKSVFAQRVHAKTHRVSSTGSTISAMQEDQGTS